ncbi:MAG: molybdopterin-binding protein [Candidatus Bathyarchaeota archaeon]|nr:molybdopterin-binding protein [Candidatus Bathyarchaeota archaeon]
MFRRLLSFSEAQEAIQKNLKAKPFGTEQIPLLEACGRVIAEDVASTIAIPPFNRSTVDGYAVKAKDTFAVAENSPVALSLCGTVNVGEMPKITVAEGQTAEIATGAPIPEGADAVVMVEHTERKEAKIFVYSAVARNENVMKAGADIKKGETVLRTGAVLGSREIGALAALGLAKVKVYKAPRVAVLSTGAEVAEPGKQLPAGKIFDINAYSLSAAVRENGGAPVFLGVFPDEKNLLEQALRKALASSDAVVTSGGVSVGPKDIMPKILGSMDNSKVFVCGVAIKPGKPVTVALVDGKPVFSLPGHPTSALLTFYLLAAPVIRSMAGRKADKPLEIRACVSTRLFSAKGRRTFVMVRLKREKSGRLVAEPVEAGLSGAITTLAKADGFVEVAENRQFVEADEEVTVRLFKGGLAF